MKPGGPDLRPNTHQFFYLTLSSDPTAILQNKKAKPVPTDVDKHEQWPGTREASGPMPAPPVLDLRAF